MVPTPTALGVEPGLESTRFFQPTDMTYSSGAHVALVELDALSACVRILGYWISHDSGRLINPLVVEGQIQGAVALGIGSALLEEITYDESGQLLAGSYMDYLLPTAPDVPNMAIDHLETLSPLSPLRLKGVGESGAYPSPPSSPRRSRMRSGPSAVVSRACRSGPRACWTCCRRLPCCLVRAPEPRARGQRSGISRWLPLPIPNWMSTNGRTRWILDIAHHVRARHRRREPSKERLA